MATNAPSQDDDCSIGSTVAPDAESLLQEEMMKLSLEDRNKVQEEIHGVQSLAKEESPEFLRKSLRQLDFELKSDNIPLDERKAYLKSQELFANKNKKTYVNTDEFRLRFLRCVLFDIPLAAKHINRFLLVVSKLFGDYALQRPIRISDFSKEELREFRKARFQFLPFRDRAGVRGRRILTVFPDEEWGKFSIDLRSKILLYLCYAAGEDIDVQKNGIVVIIWFDNAWESSTRAHFVGATTGGDGRALGVRALGVRLTSVHICTPDTPKSRFRRAMMMARLGGNGPKVKINVGKSVELVYSLQGFGIPVEYLPISFSGNVKEKYIKEWMRLRQLIEDERLNPNWTVEFISNMIESPYLDDIIFRNGTKLLSHPGNIALRSVIVEKCMLEENKEKYTKELVALIISEMKGRRFLIWHEKGWWKQAAPEKEPKEIYIKISRIVRDTRKLLREQQEAKAASSSDSMPEELNQQSRGSYMFLSGGQKRQKL
mmetsp:Transcript_3028/g.7143  ORF Transcript_3028/g.7143 Transcript_3028/m.7143 type:complete len:487 (-) Transcript_3028:149-1609(-)